MRHRVYGKHLGRDKNQRTALFKGLIRSLILSESIITTEAKAKAVRGLVDHLISASLKKTNSAKRVLESTITQKDVQSKLVTLAPRFEGRVSGFTTLVRLGMRQGDGTMLVKMSLVDNKESSVVSSPREAGHQPSDETVEKKLSAVRLQTSEKIEVKTEVKKRQGGKV